MKTEYNFFEGERRKFYDSGVHIRLPIYLDPDVNEFMSRLAQEQDVDVQALVNEWLRMNIRLVQSVQQSS